MTDLDFLAMFLIFWVFLTSRPPKKSFLQCLQCVELVGMNKSSTFIFIMFALINWNLCVYALQTLEDNEFNAPSVSSSLTGAI